MLQTWPQIRMLSSSSSSSGRCQVCLAGAPVAQLQQQHLQACRLLLQVVWQLIWLQSLVGRAAAAAWQELQQGVVACRLQAQQA
jgi:hypothetical protein